MSWLPDSGWLRALDLRASTFAAVALGCWAVLGLAEFDLLYLGMLPTWGRAVVAIVAVLASALWLGRAWDLVSARWRVHRKKRAVRAQLDKLSSSERALLAHQVAANEQTFTAYFDSPILVGLRHKGLVLPARTGYEAAWPHTIPDFVWCELKRRWPAPEQPEA